VELDRKERTGFGATLRLLVVAPLLAAGVLLALAAPEICSAT
jgi:hypothetical protein